MFDANKTKRANKIVFLLLIRDQEVGGPNALARPATSSDAFRLASAASVPSCVRLVMPGARQVPQIPLFLAVLTCRRRAKSFESSGAM